MFGSMVVVHRVPVRAGSHQVWRGVPRGLRFADGSRDRRSDSGSSSNRCPSAIRAASIGFRAIAHPGHRTDCGELRDWVVEQILQSQHHHPPRRGSCAGRMPSATACTPVTPDTGEPADQRLPALRAHLVGALVERPRPRPVVRGPRNRPRLGRPEPGRRAETRETGRSRVALYLGARLLTESGAQVVGTEGGEPQPQTRPQIRSRRPRLHTSRPA